MPERGQLGIDGRFVACGNRAGTRLVARIGRGRANLQRHAFDQGDEMNRALADLGSALLLLAQRPPFSLRKNFSQRTRDVRVVFFAADLFLLRTRQSHEMTAINPALLRIKLR